MVYKKVTAILFSMLIGCLLILGVSATEIDQSMDIGNNQNGIVVVTSTFDNNECATTIEYSSTTLGIPRDHVAPRGADPSEGLPYEILWRKHEIIVCVTTLQDIPSQYRASIREAIIRGIRKWESQSNAPRISIVNETAEHCDIYFSIEYQSCADATQTILIFSEADGRILSGTVYMSPEHLAQYYEDADLFQSLACHETIFVKGKVCMFTES